jgi:hypothetical protein
VTLTLTEAPRTWRLPVVEIKPTAKHVVQIWWSYAWRLLLIASLAEAVTATLLATFKGALGPSFGSVDKWVRLLLGIAVIFAPLVVFPWLFSARWRNFRIALISPDELSAAATQTSDRQRR